MMKKKNLLLAALAMMSMTFVACSSNAASNTEKVEADQTEQESPEAITEATPVTTEGVVMLADDELFRPETKVDAPTILDFNATWCVPCKKLTPAFDKAAENFAGKANFYSVDIDKNPKTRDAFNIQSVPTVVVLSPDGTMQTYVGLVDFGVKPGVEADNITEVVLANITEKINALLK